MSLNVLIIRLSAIGDVIHTLPIASEIKEIAPGARITWVVEQAASDLVQNNPAIDRVLIFPGKAAMAQLKSMKFGKTSWNRVCQFFQDLRAESYDAAIDAQGLFKSAILTYMSGAKIRIGFADAREFGDRFLTDRVDVGDYFGPDRPVVDLNLELAKKLKTIYNLAQLSEPRHPQFILPMLPDAAVTKAGFWINELHGQPKNVASPAQADGMAPITTPSSNQAPVSAGVPCRTDSTGHIHMHRSGIKTAVLIPGTTWDSKIWPLEHWLRLAETMIDELNVGLILVGSRSEVATNSEIANHIRKSGRGPILDLTQQTSLLELQALFLQTDLVVGVDTGPLHLAAATTIPQVVGIFGSTPACRNGPYGENCLTITMDLDCQPCFRQICPLSTKACLVDMSPEFVFARMTDFLDIKS